MWLYFSYFVTSGEEDKPHKCILQNELDIVVVAQKRQLLEFLLGELDILIVEMQRMVAKEWLAELICNPKKTP